MSSLCNTCLRAPLAEASRVGAVISFYSIICGAAKNEFLQAPPHSGYYGVRQANPDTARACKYCAVDGACCAHVRYVIITLNKGGSKVEGSCACEKNEFLQAPHHSRHFRVRQAEPDASKVCKHRASLVACDSQCR